MTKRRLMIGLLVGALAITFTAVGATFFTPQMAAAAGSGWGRGWFQQLVSGISSRETRLAEALGITVTELQAAEETAKTTAIQQAVEKGFITQAQADQMLLWNNFGFGGGDRFMLGRGGLGQQMKAAIDRETLLAEALGISTAELDAAKVQAELAGVQEALDAGLIAQVQADQMKARIQMKEYVDREELLAESLGLTVAEYRAALAEGKTITTLLAEQKTDAITVRQKMMTAFEAAVQQAVTDGVITQVQADQILSRGLNFGGRDGGFGSRMRGGDWGRGEQMQRGGGWHGRGGQMPQGQPQPGQPPQNFQFNDAPLMPEQEAAQLF